MSVRVRVKVDLSQLTKYVDILTKAGNSGWNQIMIKWIVRYKKFAQAQFNLNSSGGGAWPPLKLPIRKRVKKRSRQILRDSDTLKATLDPIPTLDHNPAPGILTTRFGNSLRIQFGGAAKHPYSRLTVARLATVHHLGLGNVPKREILIEPTEEIQKRCVQDVKDVANKIKRDLGMK